MTEYLNTHNASLLLSAANKSHYPQDDLPEIALAGRSNVGKSSFINTLLGRKNLARTSSKPGKTQLLNFYNIDDKLRFVDVPGYGYAKVSKTERAKWGKELIFAVGDGVKIFLRISSEFLSSMPGILAACVSVALVVTIAKLIGGRQ